MGSASGALVSGTVAERASTSHGEREGGGLAGCTGGSVENTAGNAARKFTLPALLFLSWCCCVLILVFGPGVLETCAVRVRNDAQQATAAGGRTSTAAQRLNRPNEHEE